MFLIFYFNNPLLVFRLSSPVCDSEAAHDRGPAQPSQFTAIFDDCASNTQPNGLKFGGRIVHIR